MLALLLFTSLSTAKKTESSSSSSNSNDLDSKGDDGESNEDVLSAIEENPDYQEPANDSNENFDLEDEEEEDDPVELGDEASVKMKIDVALKKSKRQYKKLLKYAKKNRAKITLALAVFAFRYEIRKTIVHLIKNELMDPRTGKLRVSPTNMLKLFLFVDVMRRFQSGRNASQPGFQAIANLGETNPLVGVFFNRMLRVPLFNPSFIPPVSQHYTFERINERYIKDGMALHKAIHAKHEGFKWPTAETVITRSMIAGNRMPNLSPSNETVVVVDMTGLDTSLSTMGVIRDQVSFLVSNYRAAAMMDRCSDSNATAAEHIIETQALEIVILLESPGGSAAEYGLAAQQLLRLRNESDITLTICVDKVAASGGYMMACAASPGHLFAAPFAIVGSIGVIGQIINVQKLLEGWGLTPMVFRGGKDKAPLGLIGEVSDDAKTKTQSLIDITHKAFQDLVVSSRPALKKHMKKVGSGDIFMGEGAIDVGLIDQIMTSDEYIANKVREGARVLKLVKNRKARFPFGSNFDNYDTTLESRSSLSITSWVLGAGRRMAQLLGVETQVNPGSTFHQTATIVPAATTTIPNQ